MIKHIKIAFSFAVFLLCAQAAAWAASPSKTVRVLILKDPSEIKVAVKSDYSIMDLSSRRLIQGGRALPETRIIATDGGFLVGTKEYLTSRIKIIPYNDANLYVNGRKLRGDLIIIKNAQNSVLVVNAIELENYIKGVMFHEVSHYWPMESLKAQAVAARTYALYQMKMNLKRDYDVTNDIYSQVYGGQASERYRTNIAVDRTKGLILTYKKEILPAYFHATCGGFTEDASALWKIDLPPLRSVECNYCGYSPHYHWKKNMRLKTIQDALNAKGYSLWLIKDISVVERNETGRIKTLKIETRDGKGATVSGKDFRDIVGPNIIKSNNYEIHMQGYYVDFIGKGWGHGVGMCQWGAAEMSYRGFKYEEILRFYYPGAEIESNETVRF